MAASMSHQTSEEFPRETSSRKGGPIAYHTTFWIFKEFSIEELMPESELSLLGVDSILVSQFSVFQFTT